MPKSNRSATIEEAREALGDEYCEQPIFAKAGSTVFYDIALFHTRLDGHQLTDGGQPTPTEKVRTNTRPLKVRAATL